MELTYNKSYAEYKAELDAELNRTAEGFVKIGYLLRVARDTPVLRESGYTNVNEFAKTEYGIDKTQVSRFIRINEKFSKGGYSGELLEEYKGFGYSKLTLMLALPDAINEALSPSFTKSEISAIKEEVEEEQKVSDIERMLEPQESMNIPDTMICKAVWQIGEEYPQMYIDIAKGRNIREVMAPAGEAAISVRIPGVGRMMVILNAEGNCRVVNVRNGVKEDATWEDMKDAWCHILAEGDPEKNWERIYRKEFARENKKEDEPKKESASQPKKTKVEKAKVAPVQSKNDEEIQKNKDETEESEKVSKNEDEKEPENTDSYSDSSNFLEKQEENQKDEKENEIFGNAKESFDNTEEDENTEIDGQMGIMDYPEAVPDSMKKSEDPRKSGYKAAVTNNLNNLKKLWEGNNEIKIELMLDLLDDLKWRLEKIKEIEEAEKEED